MFTPASTLRERIDASHPQTCPGEHRQAECKLRHDEAVGPAPCPVIFRGGPSCLAEDVGQPDLRCLKRRDEAAQNGRADADLAPTQRHDAGFDRDLHPVGRAAVRGRHPESL